LIVHQKLYMSQFGSPRSRGDCRSKTLTLVEAWDSLRLQVDEFIEAGDHVVMPNTLHARGRDGVEVQAHGAWVWTIRDGSITHLCFYQERQEALQAVGLSDG
jgi:ketosteroid isomerase-like protein